MNVLIISPEFPEETNWGGIATYNYNLALLLSELKHSVKVITLCKSKHTIHTNIEVIPVTKKSHSLFYNFFYYNPITSLSRSIFKTYFSTTAQILSWNFFSCLTFFELNKRWKPDVVFTTDFFSPALLLQVLKPSLPIIQVLHGPQMVFGEYQKQNMDLMLQIMLEKWALFSNIYPKICGSKSLANILTKKGIRKVTYIPHFIKDIKAQSSISNFQKNNIVFFGRVEPRKGADLLVTAFNKIAHSDKDTRLFFIGTQMQNFGKNKDQKLSDSEICSSLPESIKERIFFIPQIDNKQFLFWLLEKLNGIVVLPARYEPVGFSSIEALLNHHIILTTKNSEPLLKHKENGFYCEPTVVSIVKNIQYIRKLKPAAIKTIKKNSSQMVKDYISFEKAKVRYGAFLDNI